LEPSKGNSKNMGDCMSVKFDKQNSDSYFPCGCIQEGYVDLVRVIIKVYERLWNKLEETMISQVKGRSTESSSSF
jgi:hypothetical protein